MDVTITQKTPTVIRAEVNVPWDADLEGLVKLSLKDIAKHAQLPGFRKGKAPAALLKKRFHQEISGEVARKLIPDHVERWVKEKEIRSAGQPRLDHFDLKEKDRFHYSVEMDVYPEFELKEWRGVEAESLIVAVEDNMVDDEMERRRQAAATQETITDEPAAEGDVIHLQITAIDQATDEAALDIDRYELTVGDPEAPPSIAKLAEGMKAYDEKEAELEIPEDDPFPEWQGKKVKVYVEALEVVRSATPELDDDFAKAQGAENLEGYRAKVTSEIQEHIEGQEKMRLQNDLVAKLIKDYDFEAPGDLVLSEARAITEQVMAPYMEMLRQQGQASQRKLFEQMVQAHYPQALAKVRSNLLMDAIAKAEGFVPAEEDIAKELEAFLPYAEEENVNDLRDKMEKDGSIGFVLDLIKRRLSMDAVVDAAKLTKVEKLTAETEAEQAAEGDADADSQTENADPETGAEPAAVSEESPAAEAEEK